MARLSPLIAPRTPLLMMVGGALGIALLAVVAFSWWGSGYSVLYAGLSGEEGGRTLAELQKLNIPYNITEGGRVILVPSSDVGRARLQLAARGIPKQDGDEWAVLDNESLGVSPFVEQVHYVRGVESALSRTVRDIDGVISAKVTLAVPKETDFLGNSPKPAASVLLRLRPGTELTNTQIDGIVGLVASSVPGLSRDKVTIVDQTGRQLSADGQAGLGQAPQQLELSRAITHRYESTITDLLVPILGRGNFRVSADADVDFSQTRESLVTYGASHVLSQDETTHTRTGDGGEAGGIPGALSNRKPDNPTTAPPPQPAQPAQDSQDQNGTNPPKPAPAKDQPPTSSDVHKTTNYDIDRTVQYLERPSWTLKAISVAVLLNNASGKPMPAEKMDAVKKLVSSAIGAGQNPHITVVDLPFEDLTQVASGPGAPWWIEPWVGGVEQNAMLAVAGLLALFGGVLPLLKRVGTPGFRVAGAGGRAAGGGAARGAAAPGGPGGPNQGPNSRIPGNLSEPAAKILAAAQDVFSIEAETVQTLVNNDPARTAQVIRGWIASDRSSLKQAS